MSKAATMKPSRGIGLGGGWLSMAPQTDNTPYKPQPVAIVDDEQRKSNQAPPSGPSSDQNSPVIPPHRSKHGGLQPQPSSSSSSHAVKEESIETKQELTSPQSQSTGPSALPRRLIPRTNARFSVGDSTSQPATPASPAPSSPPLSPASGDGDQSPAAFDVRDSFAPMQWSKAAASTVPSSSRRTSQTDGEGKSGNRLQQGQRTGMVSKHKADVITEDHDDESDGERVEYAGRKWRGKTANAIEQEMEALGDRTVMSYAPDAVYLASRLEGLRRNLEAGGDRFRRWAWEDFDQSNSRGDVDGDHEMEGTDVVIAAAAKRLSQELEPHSVNALRHSSAQASYHPSPARSALLSSTILSPVQEVPADPMSTSSVQYGQDIAQAGPSHTIAGDVDRAAKEAALDSRVEIRTLRRPDLEQVRELHCYHGDGDKVDTDTYTTSAAFLLRLLVDEHYVCLVAVAKPLPEPPALPRTMSPRPPPPSLDMPATRAPVLLAGRTATNTRQNRLPIVPGQRLVTNAHHGGLNDGTPAPRSFGVGPDSETNPSSSEGDEDRMQQDGLFEQAHVARTYTTGKTSPPIDDSSSGRMEAVVEEEDQDHQMDEDIAISETEDQGKRKPESHGISSPRTEIAAAATGSRRKSSSSTVRASVLAGPTFDVAPPRAIRVMGAPPLGGMPLESETILGVVSARIKVIQRAADDFGSGNGWTGDKDASWPGLDPKGERSIITREAHIMTLSVSPGERGQGLGARLLDLLLEECKRRTAGPRIHLATGSNTFSEEAITSAPPRAHQDAPMRTVLEMHPSNEAAMQLYKKRNFNQVPGNKGTVKHFFRGDQRIPSSIRLRVGGSDAIRMERFDTPSKQSGIA